MTTGTGRGNDSDWVMEQPPGEGSPSATGDQDTPSFSAAELQAKAEEIAVARTEQVRRELQSAKDRELAQRVEQHKQDLAAVKNQYASRLKAMGASVDDIASIESTLQSQQEQADLRRRLNNYDAEQAAQAERQRSMAQTEAEIASVLAVAGIPRDNPDLVYSSREEFLASVKRAQSNRQVQSQNNTLPDDNDTAEDDSRPAGRVQRGAADVVSGSSGSSRRRNPVLDTKDPKELYRMAGQKEDSSAKRRRR